jgi:hypothetical protein
VKGHPIDPNQLLANDDVGRLSRDERRRQHELEMWFAARAERSRHRREPRVRTNARRRHLQILTVPTRRRRSLRTS